MAADRGKDIAVPLKQALAETPGLSVVRIVPRSTTPLLKLGYSDRGTQGEAFIRGETLFVGFNPSTFAPEGMNKKIAEVTEKISQGEATPSRASIQPNGLHIGSVYFTETLAPINLRRTDTYTTDDPELAKLLASESSIKVGKRRVRKVTYRSTQSSQAVFYPSETLASFAADLKYAIENDEKHGVDGVKVPIHIDFALAFIGIGDLKSLATEKPQDLQQLADQARIPSYTLPDGATSQWYLDQLQRRVVSAAQ